MKTQEGRFGALTYRWAPHHRGQIQEPHFKKLPIQGYRSTSKHPYIWVSIFPVVCNSQPYYVNKRFAFQ
jgi:hypothetical protein